MISSDSTTGPGWRTKLASLFSGVEREAWIRFFIAIFGLGFAFAAALLSTAAREAGNLPEVVEELFHFDAQSVDGVTSHGTRW